MKRIQAGSRREFYEQQGYLCPIDVLDPDEAADNVDRLSRIETMDDPIVKDLIAYKPHLALAWCDQLIRHPRIVDAVAEVLGPDLLCWGSNFFIKPPRSPSFISWHQDATYWGLSSMDVLTAWVALTPSRPENGCLRVIPASHRWPVLEHRETFAENNLLTRGQEIAVDVDETQAADLVLEPGQMSLHHALIAHGSEPNTSGIPRVGYAIRYIATHVRQSRRELDSAVLVRGTDRHGNFTPDPQPGGDFDPAVMPTYRRLTQEWRRRFSAM